MQDRRTFFKRALLSIPTYSVLRSSLGAAETARKPIVLSTWDSGMGGAKLAYDLMKSGGSAIDAVEKAAIFAEDQVSCCVGLQAYPDRDGFVTLDASIMDHKANCGAVAFLRGIAHPISVARKVMEDTPHVLLVGEGARQFALEHGFTAQPEVLSQDAKNAWKTWLKDSKYKPVINIENKTKSENAPPLRFEDSTFNHDTIGTVALDLKGDLSGSCTTSGMAFKIHGRVGDSPIIGAGLFVDNEIGAVTSSGVGEEVIRTCGSHTVIEQMRAGRSPEEACRIAVERVVKRDPKKARDLQVGYVALTKAGEFGAYSIQKGFTYSIKADGIEKVVRAKSYLA